MKEPLVSMDIIIESGREIARKKLQDKVSSGAKLVLISPDQLSIFFIPNQNYVIWFCIFRFVAVHGNQLSIVFLRFLLDGNAECCSGLICFVHFVKIVGLV